MRKGYDLGEAKRGAVVKFMGKTKSMICLDDDVIEAYCKISDAQGRRFQTLINDTLHETLETITRPPTFVTRSYTA